MKHPDLLYNIRFELMEKFSALAHSCIFERRDHPWRRMHRTEANRLKILSLWRLLQEVQAAIVAWETYDEYPSRDNADRFYYLYTNYSAPMVSLNIRVVLHLPAMEVVQ